MNPLVTLSCLNCRCHFKRRRAEHEWRLRQGIVRQFCSQTCFGESRRAYKPKVQKVAEKAAYDREYRAKNLLMLKRKKAAYYQRTYNPVKARAERKKRSKWHTLYCRRYYSDPKRKAAKVRYDADRRASEYGPFADAYKLFHELTATIRKLSPDKYERLRARGYYTRSAQQRRRNAQVSRW